MAPHLFESNSDPIALLQTENEELKKHVASLQQRAMQAERILAKVMQYIPEDVVINELPDENLQIQCQTDLRLPEPLHSKKTILPEDEYFEEFRQQMELQLQKTNQRYRLLLHTISRLLQSRDPQRIVEELCHSVLQELDAQFFFNYLLEENSSSLHLNACAGIATEIIKNIEWLELGTTVCGCVARDGCRIVADSIQVSDDPRTNLVRSLGVRAYVCHPLMSKNGQVIGTLSFGTCARDTFAEDDIALMKSVADHVAIAMERKRAEEELARVAQFPEVNPNPVLRMTVGGALLYANLPGREYLAVWDRVPLSSEPNALQTLVSRAFQSAYPVEAEILDHRGETFFFTAVQPRGEDYVNLYGRNITNRKRMEEALYNAHQILEAVLNSTPILIACLDRDFRFVIVNRAYAAADEKEPHFFPGRHHFVLYPNAENEALFRQVLETAQPFFVRAKPFAYAEHPERGVSYWDWSLSPVCNVKGEVEFLVLSLADVTPVRQAEEALREADRRKDEFLAILGHELRNPVAAIVNAAGLLNRPNQLPEKQRWMKNIIAEQAQQLLRLINDLQDVSRIARGKIKLEITEVKISNLIERSVETVGEICRAMGHRLVVEMPNEESVIKGDSARLQQILVNLLNNACKYTPEGGEIHLAVQAESDALRFRVTDNGIGIPQEVQQYVFDMFTQVEAARQRSQGGLGIGLSLVKMLTELHSGSVSVYSEGEGKGSAFEIRLPKSHPITPFDIPIESIPVMEGLVLQILVVEDNPALAHMLSDVLTEQGHKVEHAHDGLEALILADRHRPDVVLLDIGLPKLDGYEVARRLRTDLKLTDTLLVAITAWGQERDRKRSAESGIDHHLVKPIEFEKIAQILNQWFLQRHPNTKSSHQKTESILTET